jgi:hypothetical protein
MPRLGHSLAYDSVDDFVIQDESHGLEGREGLSRDEVQLLNVHMHSEDLISWTASMIPCDPKPIPKVRERRAERVLPDRN